MKPFKMLDWPTFGEIKGYDYILPHPFISRCNNSKTSLSRI
jgi:hypothetical protein